MFFTEVLGRICGRTKAPGADRLGPAEALNAANAVLQLEVSLFAPDPRQDSARLLKLGRICP
ncbi:hypothetical protein SAMN05443668_101424 [Cryptosporangium aurantiacum]|uniref:Uncharacterized protein n=1 Tax=Cryptosporangium aurantiacum TaxID=134849 RepID=A0A1M7I869_9ACTN|nr:hypothetical protein SAMN05443668_101424 [Cryptosporangium aurantiacum]